MTFKKFLSLVLSFVFIFSFSAVSFFAEEKNAVGTGEKRPETWVRTRQYSRFRKTCERYNSDDLTDYTLNGVLADKELEYKINDWVIHTLKTTNLTGVVYTAVNGYMDVTVGMYVGEIVFIMPEAQNSVWNLKTGERVYEFSDLFYEGTDYIPAVEKAIGGKLDKVPKNFSATGLTRYRYAFDFDAYGGPDINAPLYDIMPAVWDIMPVWNYYDMSKHFTDVNLYPTYLYIANEFTVETSIVENLVVAKVYSPIFLSEEEVETRNSELEELYDIILESSEFKNYVQPPMNDTNDPWYRFEQEDYNHYDFPRDLTYRENAGYYVRHFYYLTSDDVVKPIMTLVSFPDDAAKALIDTPFGTFYRVRETGEIYTPSTHKMLTVNEDFAGFVDMDFDGKPERISVDNVIRVYDEKMEQIMTLPFKYDNYGLISIWKTVDESNGFSGEIYYKCKDNTFAVIKYTLSEAGRLSVFEESKIEGAPKADFYIDDMNTVVYMGNMLSRDDTDIYDGSAEADFNALHSQIKALEKMNSYLVITDFKGGKMQTLTVCNEDKIGTQFINAKLFENGVEITPEMFQYDYIEVLSEDLNNVFNPTSLIIISSTAQVPRPIIGRITENGFEEYPLSGMIYNLHHTNYAPHEMVGTTSEYQDGHKVWLDYWFWCSGEKIKEYGGIEMPEEDFKNLRGNDDTYTRIAAEKGTIKNILYRNNDIINVNYINPYGHIYHLTYRLKIVNSEYELEFIEASGGEIQKAFLEEIASIPYSYPKKEN